MPSIAIIIPCYNEAGRLNKTEFIQFAQNHSDVNLFFINDGSQDGTKEIIQELQELLPQQIKLLNLIKNKGKAEAVRHGILNVSTTQFKYIGFLDADLSTPIPEFYRLFRLAKHENAAVVFGSRIKKAGSDIRRSGFRHTIGRIIATIIDKKFQLGYYDTQCGAKVFEASLIREIVKFPFYTKWFFDVEIFLRIKKLCQEKYEILEVPLTIWHTRKNSKINVLSFPSVLKELSLLLNKY